MILYSIDTNVESMKAGYLMLSEWQTILNVNTHHRCSKWSMDEFLNCAKDLFKEENLPKINCTIYNFKEFIDPETVEVPLCNSAESAADVYRHLLEYYDTFLFDSKDTKCLVPCTQTGYDYQISYYSKPGFSSSQKPDVDASNYFYLITFFTRMETEERTEVLVYDMVAFLSAAGGNLGLFVGFSCLSVIFALIDVSWELCRRLKNLLF